MLPIGSLVPMHDITIDIVTITAVIAMCWTLYFFQLSYLDHQQNCQNKTKHPSYRIFSAATFLRLLQLWTWGIAWSSVKKSGFPSLLRCAHNLRELRCRTYSQEMNTEKYSQRYRDNFSTQQRYILGAQRPFGVFRKIHPSLGIRSSLIWDVKYSTGWEIYKSWHAEYLKMGHVLHTNHFMKRPMKSIESKKTHNVGYYSPKRKRRTWRRRRGRS